MSGTRPFVLLATRPEDAPADAEYELFLRHGGLRAEQLLRVRLDRGPLPDLDLDAISGILVGGSPFNSSDPPERISPLQRRVEAEMADLLTDVIARDLPFFGACYGVGTLGARIGATIDRRYGEPAGIVPVTLTDEGARDPLLEGLPRRFDAYVGHKEAISRLPEPAVLLASSPGCPVQMFRVGENVYATQFHPELDADGIVERMRAYTGHGYFAPDELDATIAAVRRVPVTEPRRILRRFVERYAR